MAWLARNYDNKLFIHEELPRKYMGNYISKGISFRVKNVEFNTVTYENSPVHISKFDKVVEDTSTYDYVYVLAIIGGSSDRGVMGIHDNINNMLKCTNGGKPTQVKNEDYYYDLGILHEDKTVKLLYNDDIVWEIGRASCRERVYVLV